MTSREERKGRVGERMGGGGSRSGTIQATVSISLYDGALQYGA